MHAVRLIVLALFLSGCSQLQPRQADLPAAPISWDDYVAYMQSMQHWQLLGKAGIRTPQQSDSAGFSWQQNLDRYDISLFGPFNAQAARIKGNDQQVSLEADGQVYRARSPEALLEQHLGWQLPVRDLAWWIRGLPAPDSPYSETRKNDRLASLQQQGWQISYRRYSPDNRHPEKLILQRDKLRITLVIHEWEKISAK